jgi:cell division protein FtsW (lipid II flippase)
MRSPLVPVALFVTLVLSVVVVLPLAGSPFVSIAFFGFMASLGGLAWWVVCADEKVALAAAAIAPAPMPLATEMVPDDDIPLEQDWDAFESDFWTHVAEQETAWGSD